MNKLLNFHLPIRIRLTLWYVLLLAVTFALLSIYLIYRVQNSLIATVDNSLKVNVDKTIAALDEEEDFRETGILTFDIVEKSKIRPSRFAMRVVSPQGDVWDDYGEIQNLSDWGTLQTGYATRIGNVDEDDEWRILTQPVTDSNNEIIAWVQAAQSMASINESMQDLQEQVVWAIPLILIFAGLGGYFLADRALGPIKQITNTAQEITAQGLSQRLAYQGPADEIGQLAATFDQMLTRLQVSFERERQFTSDAAHELRTPLTVLKGQIEVTLNRSRTPAEYDGKLQELLVQVDRLIRLSNALLFLSRSDQHQLSWNPTQVNLRELLDALIEQIQPLAQDKGLSINTSIPDKLSVYGDSDHLISLFMNLLDNALKYTPAGGQIKVEADNGTRDVQVRIYNTGAGISSQHLQYLFNRFYRVEADRSSQIGGSGLGLAIAQEIVRLHHGEILVENKSGQGVTFSVRLPLNTHVA